MFLVQSEKRRRRKSQRNHVNYSFMQKPLQYHKSEAYSEHNRTSIILFYNF